MSNADETYDFDRYRQLLAEASDESKRLAFIDLLIQEKAKDRLAEHVLRTRAADLALRSDEPSPRAAPSVSAGSSREPS